MIRKYSEKDKSKVIDLLRLNTPQYFDQSEEVDYLKYLDKEIEDYYVFLDYSKIIAAGGINYFYPQNKARISWDIVRPDSQGKGIGRKLTEYRIEYLNTNSDIEWIEVRTTQLAYKFYEKLGFAIDKIEKDYWAKNFDLYLMLMKNDTHL